MAASNEERPFRQRSEAAVGGTKGPAEGKGLSQDPGGRSMQDVVGFGMQGPEL